MAAALRDFGLADGCLYLVNRIGERFLHRWLRAYHYRLVELGVEQALPRRLQRPDPELVIRPVTAGEPEAARLPLTPEVLAARIAQGATCLAAWHRDRFAGYLWLLPGPYQEDEVRCRYHPPATGAWDFDLYVAPEFRTGLVFLRLWQAAFEWLKARGRDHTLSRISAYARGSLEAHTRLGARLRGHAWFLCCGRLQLTVATLPPRLHLSWSPRHQPEFHFDA